MTADFLLPMWLCFEPLIFMYEYKRSNHNFTNREEIDQGNTNLMLHHSVKVLDRFFFLKGSWTTSLFFHFNLILLKLVLLVSILFYEQQCFGPSINSLVHLKFYWFVSFLCGSIPADFLFPSQPLPPNMTSDWVFDSWAPGRQTFLVSSMGSLSIMCWPMFSAAGFSGAL